MKKIFCLIMAVLIVFIFTDESKASIDKNDKTYFENVNVTIDQNTIIPTLEIENTFVHSGEFIKFVIIDVDYSIKENQSIFRLKDFYNLKYETNLYTSKNSNLRNNKQVKNLLLLNSKNYINYSNYPLRLYMKDKKQTYNYKIFPYLLDNKFKHFGK